MPGYDCNRFVNLSPSDRDELTCSICLNIICCPVIAQCCLQTFCKDCINNWLSTNNTCPYDRKTLTKDALTRPPRVMVNMLGKLQIKCDFRDNGCTEVIILEYLTNHLNNLNNPLNNQREESLLRKINELEAERENLLKTIQDLINSQQLTTSLSNVRLTKNTVNLPSVSSPQSIDLSDSFIYICGGYDGTSRLSVCYKYNTQTSVWQSIQSMSTPRVEFSLISMDSKLYAIGGCNGKNNLNSVETYDTQTNQWKSIASMSIIRSGHDATVLENTIYVCCGYNDNTIKSCEYYSQNNKEWSFVTPMSHKRNGLALVAHNGFIYAIGGNNGKEYLNTMERYDTKTQQWQPMANMTNTRGYFGSASFMGKIYVCGGEGNSDGKSCETYDPKTNQWTQIASMLLERAGFKLIAFNNKLYALGGQTNVIAQCCRQTFCEDCINNWLSTNNTCPYDRKTLTTEALTQPPRIMVNMLGKLQIKCDFQDKGCTEVIILEYLTNHLNNCRYNPSNIQREESLLRKLMN
ncbi:kelch-like protein 5 [Oppia nitens]|uniref:kelch-like protein 5 n=1 Tax=Oppia nitens TaxID=1686743 RepID=UPI0023DABCE2|nr:kelch-like protein 5 [Oppia nitens]